VSVVVCGGSPEIHAHQGHISASRRRCPTHIPYNRRGPQARLCLALERNSLIDIQPTVAAPEAIETDLLAIGVLEGADMPPVLQAAAEPALLTGDFTGKRGQSALLYGAAGVSAPRLLLVGLGKREKFVPERVRQAAATAAQRANRVGAKSAALVIPALDQGVGATARAVTEGASLGLYTFDRYKSERGNEPALRSLRVRVRGEEAATAARGIRVGGALAAGTALARDLANEPSNTATPEYLARAARDIAERHGMAVEVLDQAGIEAEGLNGLAAVGRSAANEPRFIVLRHAGGEDEAPVVLVGKAVTFDSGGISIKPVGGMEDMKFDMSGGAAVLGAMDSVGTLDLPINVVALVPSTENLPAGDAFKPGDVLKMHSGKTVEILTTDAEGRLILADALSYARRFEPAAVVDCATLTGACVVALGNHASGLMGNDEGLVEEVRAAGERAGERAWPLPLFEAYTEQIRGDTADLKNSGGRPGGALTAGAFLKEFADYPWAHLDIAGTAYGKKGNPYTPKGATGTPARLLVEFLLGRLEEET
jgi:leucyl aminopeptidase